jgi:hypothetical protein
MNSDAELLCHFIIIFCGVPLMQLLKQMAKAIAGTETSFSTYK